MNLIAPDPEEPKELLGAEVKWRRLSDPGEPGFLPSSSRALVVLERGSSAPSRVNQSQLSLFSPWTRRKCRKLWVTSTASSALA